METGVITVSRNVIFNETEFPFQTDLNDTKAEVVTEIPQLLTTTDHGEFDMAETTPPSDLIPPRITNDTEVVIVAETPDATEELPAPVLMSSTNHDISSASENDLDSEPELDLIHEPEPEPLGRGHRQKRPPTKLLDYITNTVHSTPNYTPFPIYDYDTCDLFSESHQIFLAAINDGIEPQFYFEAMQDGKW